MAPFKIFLHDLLINMASYLLLDLLHLVAHLISLTPAYVEFFASLLCVVS